MSIKNLLYVTLLVFSLLTSAQASQQSESYLWAKRYNLSGQVTGEIHPDPDGTGPLGYTAIRNTYDSGFLVSIEKGYLSSWQADDIKPANWSGFTVLTRIDNSYDAWGKTLSSITTSVQDSKVLAIKQYQYDSLGRLQCEMVRMFDTLAANACSPSFHSDYGYDRVTYYTYDERDNVLTIEKAYGTPLYQVYKAATYYDDNQLKTVKDANNNLTTYTYNSFGYLDKVEYPSKNKGAESSSSTDYHQFIEYDSNGNLKKERKRDGTIITYSYDNLNRQLTKQFPDSNHNVSYTYRNDDLTTSTKFTSSNRGTVNTYDGFGNLEMVTDNSNGLTRTLKYTYDKNSNRQSIEHHDGKLIEYSYDYADRHAAIKVPSYSSSNVIDYNYNQFGQLDSMVRKSSNINNTIYEFEANNRLSRLNHDVNNITNSDFDAIFTYSPANQIVTYAQKNTSYIYDNTLTNSASYVANGLNQYSNVDGETINYDDNGNLLNYNGSTYSYDYENRLISVSGNVTATLSYDPLGRLSKTVINGVNKTFLYDGDALITEFNSSGSVTDRFVHGGQVDNPLIQFWGSSTTSPRYLHANHQGSIVALTDTDGERLYINRYNEYGIPDAANDGRFGYTGQLWLEELGLYYYKARIYHPKLGRFLQTDPVGYEDQMNLYAYVGNDPINYIDPSGEVAFMAIPIVIGALTGALENYAEQSFSGKEVDGMEVLKAGLKGAALGAIAGAVVARTMAKAGKTMLEIQQAAHSSTALKAAAVSTSSAVAVGAVSGALQNDSSEIEQGDLPTSSDGEQESNESNAETRISSTPQCEFLRDDTRNKC